MLCLEQIVLRVKCVAISGKLQAQLQDSQFRMKPTDVSF
jgi:hypothetical protein